MNYPILRTFFDADAVACVFVSDLLSAYPNIGELTVSYPVGSKFKGRTFISFAWDIGNKNVMSAHDAQFFVRLYKLTSKRLAVESISFDDIDANMVCLCGICDTLLFPDDEAYTDVISGKNLCDKHAIFDEVNNNYVENTN